MRQEFRECRSVLEIGSGTGQHAVAFARELPHLAWQTSDLDENHVAIEARIAASGLDNVRVPMSLDVRYADDPPRSFEGVFSCNTAHIMSAGAVEAMFALVGKALQPGGTFCLYGPFRIGGLFNTASNERFDASLRSRDPEMGIRDLETLDDLAGRNGICRSGLYAMPSNNFLAAWQKSPEKTQ